MRANCSLSGILIATLFLLGSSQSMAAEHDASMDPCDLADSDMFLKRTWLERGRHLGLFEIRSASHVPPNKFIEFSGWKKRNGFVVDEPSVSFEFMDANGTWHWRLQVTGTYESPPDRLIVPYLGRAEVIATLPDSELAVRAPQWRMTLRNHDNTQCKRSAPFSPVQNRGPLRGFRSTKKMPTWTAPESTKAHCPGASPNLSLQPTLAGCAVRSAELQR